MTSPNPYADQWAALIKQMDAERAQKPSVIITTTPPPAPTRGNATWCRHCAAYIRPDGVKSCLRKSCEHKETTR